MFGYPGRSYLTIYYRQLEFHYSNTPKRYRNPFAYGARDVIKSSHSVLRGARARHFSVRYRSDIYPDHHMQLGLGLPGLGSGPSVCRNDVIKRFVELLLVLASSSN